jgi:hypothetical protein
MPFRRIVPLVLVVALAGCSEDNSPLLTVGESAIRVLNAAAQPVDVLVDGVVVSSAVPASAVSSRLALGAGSHTVQVRGANGATASVAADTKSGDTRVIVAQAAGAGLAAAVLDTGGVVPAGKSKMRIAHLAPSAPAIESWRTQPDFPTPTHLVTPFQHGLVSSYFQSDAGTWEVWVTAVGGTAKLATTGAFTIPDGQRRTVALVDSAGTLRMRVIEE